MGSAPQQAPAGMGTQPAIQNADQIEEDEMRLLHAHVAKAQDRLFSPRAHSVPAEGSHPDVALAMLIKKHLDPTTLHALHKGKYQVMADLASKKVDAKTVAPPSKTRTKSTTKTKSKTTASVQTVTVKTIPPKSTTRPRTSRVVPAAPVVP